MNFLLLSSKTIFRKEKSLRKRKSGFLILDTFREEEEEKARLIFKGKTLVETLVEGSSPLKKKKYPIYKGRSLYSLDSYYLLYL